MVFSKNLSRSIYTSFMTEDNGQGVQNLLTPSICGLVDPSLSDKDLLSLPVHK